MAARPSDFDAFIRARGLPRLSRRATTTVQVNVGKLCNQSCFHCHVEAGPGRREIMELRTVERLLSLLEKSPGVELVDVTGGAPELNPHFERLVSGARSVGRRVTVRSNLTVLVLRGREGLIPFLAEHGVGVVASLPCYTADNVDRQRGTGVFEQSIRALRCLNAAGYGQPGSPLELDLVYNPLGPSLPPDQTDLEQAYKRELGGRFGIVFNRLFTLTNMPISRFADQLARGDGAQAYQELLVGSFRSDNLEQVMCRDLLSVDWTGALYDCDFNQMLEIPLRDRSLTLWNLETFDDPIGAPIATASHCFACTAGAGSSCGGTLTATETTSSVP